MNKIIEKTIKILDDRKAEQITCLDLRKVTTITDYFIIATANSETHSRSLANELINLIKKEKQIVPKNPRNFLDSTWIILDYQDFVVHVFLQKTREYYDLESLWFEAKKVAFNKK